MVSGDSFLLVQDLFGPGVCFFPFLQFCLVSQMDGDGDWVTVTRCFLCSSSRSSSRAKQNNNPLYITSIHDEGGMVPLPTGALPSSHPCLYSRVMLMMTYSSKVSHSPLIRKK